MKGLMLTTLLPFLCLLGRGATAYSHQLTNFENGKAYTYQVHSEVNGANRVPVEYTLTFAKIGPYTIYVKPSNLKVIGAGGPSAFEISSEFRRHFESPAEINLNGGIVSSIKVEKSLPEYSISLKKQIATQIMLQAPGNQEMSRARQIQTNSIQRYDGNGQSNYQTDEETIYGQCQAKYQIEKQQIQNSQWGIQNDAQDSSSSSESASASSDWNSESQEYQEHSLRSNSPPPCPSNSQHYQITKTINVNECERKNVVSLYGSFGTDAIVTTKTHVCAKNEQSNFGSGSSYTILSIQETKTQKRSWERLFAQMSINLVSIRPVQKEGLEMLRDSKLIRQLSYQIDNEGHNMENDEALVNCVLFPLISGQNLNDRPLGQYYPRPNYPQPQPQPNYPQPNYPQPNYPQPNYPQPNYPQPNYPQPNYPRPNYPQPNPYPYPRPGYPQGK